MGTVGRILGAAAGVVGIAVGGWVGAGIMLAGGLIQYMSREKVGTPGSISQRQQAIRAQVSGTDASLPVVYGETIIGAKVLDVRTDPDSVNSLAVVVAFNLAGEDGGGCGPIDEIYFNDVLAIDTPVYGNLESGASIQEPWRPSGGGTYGTTQWLRYGLHDGDDAQVTNTELDAQFTEYDATHRGVGIQYAVFWMYRNEEAYPGGVPRITARVRGVQVEDPRDVSTDWENGQNPILAARDFMLSERYGMGLAASQILASSVTSEANYCDETVAIPGGTQARYRCNGWVNPAASPQENLDRILSTCRGRVVEEGGVWRFVIRRTRAAEAFELTEENIVGISEFWRGGIREVPNQITASYVDADEDYQPNEVQFPAPGVANGFLTADNNQLNSIEVDLPLCTDRYQAEQTSQILLRETRADAGIMLTATRAALQLAHGDVVPVTHSTPGWTQEEFWVEAIGIEPETGLVQLLLREYDSTAYTLDSLATKDTPPGTNHPVSYPPEISYLSSRARAAGISSNLQAWNVEHGFNANQATRSINVSVPSWIRARALDDQPPPSDTVSAYNYDVDITPGEAFLHTVRDSGGANDALYTLAYDEYNLLPGQPLTTGLRVTVTPYNATGGAGGTGTPGVPVQVPARALWDYDDVGFVALLDVDRRYDNLSNESTPNVNLSLDNTANGFAFDYTPSEAVTFTQIGLQLRRVGSPTGNLTVTIDADSAGLPGTTQDTSENLDVSTLATAYVTTTPQVVIITFPTPIALSASTLYHFSVRYSGGDATNYVDLGARSGAGSYDELNGSWAAGGSDGIIYRLYVADTVELWGNAAQVGTGLAVAQLSTGEIELTAPTAGNSLGSLTDVSTTSEAEGQVLYRGASDWNNVGTLTLQDAGTNLAPTYSFLGDPDTGMYNSAPNEVGFAAAGTLQFRVSDARARFDVPVYVPVGSAAAPGLAFIGDPDTGIYGGVNTVYFTAGGVQRGYIDPNEWRATVPVRVPDGAVGAPSLAFATDQDTGLYLETGTPAVAFVYGGTVIFSYNDTRVQNGVPTYQSDGTLAAPGYAFTDDPDTGMYRSGTNSLAFTTGAGLRMDMNSTRMRVYLPVYVPDGSGAAPQYTFANDPDTGMYRGTANGLYFTAGGTNTLRVFGDRVHVALGSAATPGLGFLDDDDTGFYQPAANQVAVSLAGAEVLRFTGAAVYVQGAQFYVEEQAELTRSTAGASTIDWDLGNVCPIRNDGNIDTVNIDDAGMVAGGSYVILSRYATGGQASITFSATGTLYWVNGNAPVHPLNNIGERLVIHFYHTAGNVTLGSWYAAHS